MISEILRYTHAFINHCLDSTWVILITDPQLQLVKVRPACCLPAPLAAACLPSCLPGIKFEFITCLINLDGCGFISSKHIFLGLYVCVSVWDCLYVFICLVVYIQVKDMNIQWYAMC